ncbi:hypothetical protein CEXT_115031 [Caerostris extrusa]|uniref:Uncharacterized protein n=1 Tax=Caerostris extrusa TaxID=172846 RepID=A0AAV4QKM3_CAEEX|nr:hypothetical protein CEXT_115031 [Caerostris extrusa]
MSPLSESSPNEWQRIQLATLPTKYRGTSNNNVVTPGRAIPEFPLLRSRSGGRQLKIPENKSSFLTGSMRCGWKMFFSAPPSHPPFLKKPPSSRKNVRRLHGTLLASPCLLGRLDKTGTLI